MRTLLALAVLGMAGCSTSGATSCVTNPGVCLSTQVCNPQTAMCQSGDGGSSVLPSTWSLDTSSGTLATTDLNNTWGSGAQDVWAVGVGGTILHYAGSTWAADPNSTKLTTYPLHGVWGSSAQDIWAVGDMGVLLHTAGSGWTADAKSRMTTTDDLKGVWGSSGQSVWPMGGSGTIGSSNVLGPSVAVL